MQWFDERGELRVKITSEDLFDPVKTIAEMTEILTGGEYPRVVIDLGGITYVQSIQIGTIVAMHMVAYENLSIIRFVNIGPRIKELLVAVGLDKIVESHHGEKVMKDSFRI